MELTGDEGRHAARVRRLAPGERLLLGDGRGALADCVVAAVTPDGLDLELSSRRYVPEPDPRLVVAQALPKGERAELAVETMTELGVDAIVPWAASRSVTQWTGPRGAKALDKWRRTAREAAKQSRRARVPDVGALATTADLRRRRWCCTRPPRRRWWRRSCPPPATSWSWSARRAASATTSWPPSPRAGAVAVRLGDPVLRTSTAGPAALAVLSARLGRWGAQTDTGA